MALIQIGAGETETVAQGDTREGGPLYLDGTLQLDGTLELGETPVTVTADAGATATPTASGAKDLVGQANAGADALDPLLPGAKNVVVAGAAGATGTAAASKAKNVLGQADAGVTATPTLGSVVPLRRTTTTSIDDTRRTAFDVQGSGETPE